MAHLKDYMKSTPDIIYYDFTDEKYSTSCPPNNHDYDIYEKDIKPRQIDFDNNPADRKWFKDRANDCTSYTSIYYSDESDKIYLYWHDYRSELYKQYTETGTTDTDLALNNIL